ncbi:succinate--CoA ligase subunit alpha [bacterium]|nr:succinate--CoA ligase subunit alpha [bacterium]|tara:strand:- start:3254 stop:4132 length:879 start_codon:yes stop_codon:yes gene_type:complete
MAILVDNESRIIVQGITGSEGSFHAEQCLAYGSNIVGGVTPGKGGQSVLEGVPVFNTCYDARQSVQANVSLIFVPAPFAAEAIMEAADAGIELVVCITEGIPVRDMIMVKAYLKNKQTRLIGPNCPGLLTPEQAKVGIMPGFIAKPGRIGVVSKSGTLTYEAVYQIGRVGLGQSTCVGIGGDPIIGTSMLEVLTLFDADPLTDAVVLIGEIGGSMEIEAAEYVQQHGKKPVIGFIAGETAPPGRRMGHAGAIVSGADESAAAKKAIMRSSGIVVVDSPAGIGEAVAQQLQTA